MTKASEWNPIFTPSMRKYALVRVVDGILQIKLENNLVVNLDARVIPQLIEILSGLEKSSLNTL